MSGFDLLHPPLPGTARPVENWPALLDGELPLTIAAAARDSQRPVLVVTANTATAEQLRRELQFFMAHNGDIPVYLFPDWETLPYDNFSPHQDIISDRLNTLYHLPALRHGVLIMPVNSLMHRLPPPDYVLSGSLVVSTGDSLDLERMRQTLVHAGYQAVESVYEHGEFAVRGAILDLYPMGSSEPYRIELFDDEIDSLRTFDPETQRSRQTVESIRLLPGREFPLNEAGIRRFRSRFREEFDVDPRQCSLYQDVGEGISSPGIEYYLPLFFDQLATVFDYLPDDTLTIRPSDLEEPALRFWKDVQSRYESRRHNVERPLLDPRRLFLDPQDIFDGLAPHEQIRLKPVPEEQATRFPELGVRSQSDAPLQHIERFIQEHADYRLLFCAESAGRRESLLELLAPLSLHLTQIDGWSQFVEGGQSCAITIAPLDRGLLLEDQSMAVITEAQLLGQRVAQRRRRRRAQDNTDLIVRNLTELHQGSAVVHADHGVGRYQGLTTLEIDEQPTEFLLLEYAGGARLYVPVASLHLISRYGGTDPDMAPLDTLGSDQWQKARRKAAEKIRDTAAELLDIYARRQARTGFTFRTESIDYPAFAAGFPFEETADQQDAINAVIADMQAPQSMDRLVCGDVGFGKTEVAMRAAFIAVQNHKQVAILVPTTLLAQQHYDSFRDRFADWPVVIDLISRFRTGKQQNETVERITSGKTDIIIGTHKLLQGAIRYKDLGLLIIDEEHRFGVQQKDRLKALRAEVDILTLTATPIPRTLNMAMSSIRDLSLIVTPPARRLSVKTFVRERQDDLIREAVLRELLRGGQVFFLHNEVRTIEQAASELQELVPEARIGTAHGQLPERELEQIMADFYHKRHNVLVCSTIIETGIDIPSANTIIIDRADRLGLAQLHQLRGRVGRSHHQAYAYMLTPPWRQMTADARKRVEAISSASSLGAGFTLASNDLEIRGAGEILGEEQTGHIQKIGFSLYTDMLDRAVQAIRDGRSPDVDISQQNSDINLRVPALIPEDYLPDTHTRLITYKRIASARDEESLRDLQVEMIDRFGLLPESTKRLFRITRLKLRAEKLGIARIDASASSGKIVFGQYTPVDPFSVVQLVQKDSRQFRLSGATELQFSHDHENADTRIDFINGVLDQLKTTESSTA
ncbi:MAG: transcription-repair coupling factor [Pseudohongiellaceae bacterium]